MDDIHINIQDPRTEREMTLSMSEFFSRQELPLTRRVWVAAGLSWLALSVALRHAVKPWHILARAMSANDWAKLQVTTMTIIAGAFALAVLMGVTRP